jgi:hypothetical protein
MKPIERGFSMIKYWLRAHENEGLLDPIGLITRAFELYSVGGHRGFHAQHHFDFYFASHANWEADI